MHNFFHTPTPDNANIQQFYSSSTWVKPRGCAQVYMMLIGAGGGGCPGDTANGGSGGGSGAVTVWWGSAQHIPDALNVNIGVGGAATVTGGATTVNYRTASATLVNLLTANGGGSNVAGTVAAVAGGTATTSGPFGNLGFYTSTAGQNGAIATGNISASTTTFVSGGGGGSGTAAGFGGSVTGQYGYLIPITTAGGTAVGRPGFFVLQPAIASLGGAGGTTSTTVGTTGGRGGIGSGGGGGGEDTLTLAGQGGDGFVLIASW
jgi:hypothetical protein